MYKQVTQYVCSISFDSLWSKSVERATNTRLIFASANSNANAFQIPVDAHVINAYDMGIINW
jgi:hypothetical protein